jgi:hypothetical protein
VDDYENPMLPVRELSPGWWIYVTGGGVDHWVQVKAVAVPAGQTPTLGGACIANGVMRHG